MNSSRTAGPVTERERCAHTIKGPRLGAHLVLWQRGCLRKVKAGERYCWQHVAEHPARSRVGVEREANDDE